MNETTRLYTRDGIKTIDYEVHLKLQKHCEEVEQMMNHWLDKFKEACQHIKDQAQEHREARSKLERELFEKDQARGCQCNRLKDALTQRVYERDSALEALENVKKRRDEYYKERCEFETNLSMALCHANKCISERDHFLDLLTVARNHLKTIKHTECDAYRVAGMGLVKTRHCNCSREEQTCCDMCTGWDDATLKGKTHLKDKTE